MIFTVTMKDPDTLHDAIYEAVKQSLDGQEMDAEEREAVGDVRAEKAHEVCQKWFKYGEYLTVEIDTGTQTIRVLENN